jgi:hypothetical protein
VERYGSKTGERALTYIYDYPDLNRLVEHDYLAIVKSSPFSEVLIVKHKKGKAPKVPVASNTRELFMLLKKGHVEIWEKSSAFLKLFYAYLTSVVGLSIL